MPEKSIGIICSSTSYGGLEINTWKLALLLQQGGWDVHLLLNSKSPMFEQARDEKMQVTAIQQVGGGDKLASAGVINKWNKECQCRILLVTYNKDISVVAAYKRFYNRKIKLVYQQHMQVGVKKKDLIHTLRYKMLDLWISPLDYLKEETIAKTRVPASKITVIPLAIDYDRFANAKSDKHTTRLQLQLPERAFIIGVLGRVDPKKGQDFLIRVLAVIKEKQPDVRLLIMGNVTADEGDSYLQQLHKLVEQYQLQDRVFFRNYIPDPTVFYTAIDVFAMPSHGETYGMVTLEAMAAGIPVIGVGRDGTREILKQGRLGWLHNLDDIDGFLKCLSEVMNDLDTVKIQAAREELRKHYNVEQMMQQIDDELEKLL